MEFVNGKWGIFVRGNTGSLLAVAFGQRFFAVVTKAIEDYGVYRREYPLSSV